VSGFRIVLQKFRAYDYESLGVITGAIFRYINHLSINAFSLFSI